MRLQRIQKNRQLTDHVLFCGRVLLLVAVVFHVDYRKEPSAEIVSDRADEVLGLITASAVVREEMVGAGRQACFFCVLPVDSEHRVLMGTSLRGLDKDELDILFPESLHVDIRLVGGDIDADRAVLLADEPFVQEYDLLFCQYEYGDKDQKRCEGSG